MENQIPELEEKIDTLILRVNALEEKVNVILSILSPAGTKSGREWTSFVAGATVSLVGIMYLVNKIIMMVKMFIKGG